MLNHSYFLNGGSAKKVKSKKTSVLKKTRKKTKKVKSRMKTNKKIQRKSLRKSNRSRTLTLPSMFLKTLRCKCDKKNYKGVQVQKV